MSVGKIKLKKMQPYRQKGNEIHRHFHLPLAWLISSILFFFIATVLAPVFWAQLDQVDKPKDFPAMNVMLGIPGIIVYILEPFIWHNSIYESMEGKAEPVQPGSEKKEKSGYSFMAGLAITLAEFVIIRFPAMVIGMFKPVLRAMILYVSLSFLNLGSGNLGEYPLFVIPVTADILLYYLDMMAPNWKFNPVRVLPKLIKIKNRRTARYIISLLLIIHTALIYSLLLGVVYYDIKHHPGKLELKNLALWWLILTIYSRMSFINDEMDLADVLSHTPKRIIWINVLALIISLIGFIWPFYSG